VGNSAGVVQAMWVTRRVIHVSGSIHSRFSLTWYKKSDFIPLVSSTKKKGGRNPMRQITVNLALTFRMPEEGLNVNGILTGLGNSMSEIFFTLVKALCSAVEEATIEKMQKEEPGRYVKNGHQSKPRQMRTKFGLFCYPLAQLYDKVSMKAVVPLRASGFFPMYEQYSRDATEAGIGLTMHTSYRLAAKEEGRILQNEKPVPVGTLHMHLQKFAGEQCLCPDMKKTPYRFLMADGTPVRMQDGKGRNLGKKQLRCIAASLGENQPFDMIGFWVDTKWKDIRKSLEKQIDYGSLEVLFHDGEGGIVEALLAEGMRPQRCLLHGKRDFPYALYSDGLKKAEQAPFKDKMEAIPAFRLNRERLEQIAPEDIPVVKELSEKTKQGFSDLLTFLESKEFPKARKYIENLSKETSTFFDCWLNNGEWIPLNTNAIESHFSQIKNRIWSVGKRWSDKGLTNWLNVARYKIFFPEMWNKIWDQYRALNPEIKLVNIGVSWSWS